MPGRVAGTRNEEIFPIIFGMHWKSPAEAQVFTSKVYRSNFLRIFGKLLRLHNFMTLHFHHKMFNKGSF